MRRVPQIWGVGALTVAQVETLRRIGRRLAAPIQITLLDWADSGSRCVDGDDIEVVRMTRRNLLHPSGAWRHLRQADLVLDIGAGDSFTDIYGPKRLRRVFFLKYLTHLARRPLVLAPQTFGPFTRRSSRILANVSIGLSRHVWARDSASVSHLRDIGIARDIGVASDVALSLVPTPPGIQPKRIAVGVNVSGLLVSGGYSAQNQFGLNLDYKALMRSLIAAFLAHPDQPEIHLIPHVMSPNMPVDDDLAAILKFAKEFPQVRVAPAFATPGEAKGYISRMSFFTGARMHACIAALSSGVAVVPLAYSRKFAGLFGALGYDFVADCRSHQSQAILEMVMLGFENRAELSERCVRATEFGKAQLFAYEDQLSILIHDIARSKEKPAAQGAAGLVGRA